VALKTELVVSLTTGRQLMVPREFDGSFQLSVTLSRVAEASFEYGTTPEVSATIGRWSMLRSEMKNSFEFLSRWAVV
jgi:hypothetical protein